MRFLAAIILLAILILPFGHSSAFPPNELAEKDLQTLKIHASQGDADAQNNLGESYFKGKGVPKNYAQARLWFEKAAAQGHAYAQNNLAELYFAGLGVPQDYVRAYMWVTLAAAQMTGDEQEQAEYNRDDVARRMTSAEVEKAKRLSQQCKARKFAGC